MIASGAHIYIHTTPTNTNIIIAKMVKMDSRDRQQFIPGNSYTNTHTYTTCLGNTASNLNNNTIMAHLVYSLFYEGI